MSLILSLETSTTVCSVALHEEGKLLTTSEIHREQSHASMLAPMIEDTLKRSGYTPGQLSAIALASGPGSYTGLRIGVSTAKGMCFALGIPLIAVDTLSLMASQINPLNWSKALLCPMIDARRMEVYCLLTDHELQVVKPVEALVVEENAFQEYLADRQIIFFGNGASKCRPVIQHQKALFLDDINPSAAVLGKIAFEKFRKNSFEDLVSFEPFYLKEFLIRKV